MGHDKDIFEKLADEGPVDASKLLTENEILSAEDKARQTESCGTNGEKKPKKPCANCTCGLADELDNKQAQSSEKPANSEPNTKSSCGSCYLGDAFRCASCPYRGQPAFKPGEKVTVDTTSDDF